MKTSLSDRCLISLFHFNFHLADWRKIYGEELYDHGFDGDENINLAHRYGFEEIKSELQNRLMLKFPRRIFKAGGLHRLDIEFH